MKTISQLGIYLDHSVAIFLELKDDAILHSSISSGFTRDDKELALRKSENLMHNKENQEQSHYYKNISNTIRNFQEVLLFGPTDAKSELFNLLKTNHFFNKKNIVVKGTDKMYESQMDEFVREYFQHQ